jgi:hypothetical protein
VTGFGLANPKLVGERQQAQLLLAARPANRPPEGSAVVTDKGLAGTQTEGGFAGLGLCLIRPARADEPDPGVFQAGCGSGSRRSSGHSSTSSAWTIPAAESRPAVGPRGTAFARAQRRDLVQLADRRAGQAVPDRLQPLTPPPASRNASTI